MMAAAYTLQNLGRSDIDLYLFDTYEGMTKPTDLDVSLFGKLATTEFERLQTSDNGSEWCYASLEDVQKNLIGTGYNKEKIRFVKGRVENTIPISAPEQISILRLDTDWYESTRHELVHLFPRLSIGGVLIVDDYGHWQGSRKAVDEYLIQNNISILLNRVDYTARIGIKL